MSSYLPIIMNYYMIELIIIMNGGDGRWKN